MWDSIVSINILYWFHNCRDRANGLELFRFVGVIAKTVEANIVTTGLGANVEMEANAGLEPKFIAALHQILSR